MRRNEDYQLTFSVHGSVIPPPTDCTAFGLRSFPDPRMDYRRISAHFLPGGALVEMPTLARLERWKKAPNYDAERTLRTLIWSFEERQRAGMRYAIFDMNEPLRAQFERVEMVVTKYPKFDRMLPPKWRGYVRILDATAEGLGVDEIASVLYPLELNDHASGYAPRKKVEQAKARATKLCDTFSRGMDDMEDLILA